eukprot:TRINITY_DN15127_c0_g1_i1.p1 TRINITY_DN15127_c0_g1~~TRINITY_DN15127_c0_g1_i1.p1  ORF type:complete len:170 (+),score=19.20 TRINITY_DN15127_c0_g1_i1:85-594(+)
MEKPIITTEVKGYEQDGKTTFYVIDIIIGDIHYRTLKKRYSEFCDMYNALAAELRGILPLFPRKTFRTPTIQIKNERIKQFDAILKSLLENPDHFGHPAVSNFLELPVQVPSNNSGELHVKIISGMFEIERNYSCVVTCTSNSIQKFITPLVRSGCAVMIMVVVSLVVQ